MIILILSSYRIDILVHRRDAKYILFKKLLNKFTRITTIGKKDETEKKKKH